MTPLMAIAYVSSAVRLLTPAELDALLVNARNFNAEAGVSGALLHHGGAFFQYFEGPADGVAQVYERIRRSPLHRGLIELDHQPTDHRCFSSWSMGFAEPTATTLQTLSQAHWTAQRNSASLAAEPTPGLALLLSFWQQASTGR